ncbi:hypothetical protein PQQ75_25615 [Paraburkholderia aspalathi]|uniref:hypothetical protein n=1 Tax=Paraburkholderia aspalathi TaxID=1324617 RepID=UPI0038BADD0E
MLYLKIMSGAGGLDSDPRKKFRLFPISDGCHVEFAANHEGTDDEQPIARIWRGTDLELEIGLPGNGYLMNEGGRTIAQLIR